MKILLVEDRGGSEAPLADILRQSGHTVVLTQDGNDALECFIRGRHDVVVTAAAAAGLDGIALTQRIMAQAAPLWQPVIYIAPEGEESRQFAAIEAGADTFFVRPVNVAALSARLAAIDRLLVIQREAERRQVEICRYLVAEENDLRMARHLIEYQMMPEGMRLLDDPAVDHWRQPSRKLGGDMLLVARTPSGVLHILLSDANGTGLSAYVSLQPIIAPFLRMTEKGFTLAAIVRELNRKVRFTLPPGRLLAAQMASVDSRSGIVSIWNGGMPPAFLLDGPGHHFHEFPLVHDALGALDEDHFDDHIEIHACTPGDQLVMVSDGLLGAEGSAGKRFGEQGLADALVGHPPNLRRDKVVAAVLAHLADTDAEDDMTLVLVDCERSTPEVSLPLLSATQADIHGAWSVDLRLAASELRHVDVIPMLLGVTEQFPLARNCSGELFLVLSELFNNALDHGLLRLDSRIKHSPDGMETWLMLREERLAALEEGEIRLWVEQVIERGRPFLRIRCSDSGDGFDLAHTLEAGRQRLSGADPSTQPYGRGLALVESVADVIGTGTRGNEIDVLLPLDGGKVAAS